MPKTNGSEGNVSMQLTCRKHESEDIFAELEPEWNQLDALTSPRRPYTSHLWSRLWWRRFSRNTALTVDHLTVFTVRDQHDTLIAIAPMMTTHRPPYSPLRVRHLQFFGADASVTDIRGLIVRPEHHGAAVRALHDHFVCTSHDWDVLRWDGLRDGTDDVDVVTKASSIRTRSDNPVYYLNLPSTWDELAARFSRNMRRNARRAYSELKDAHLPFAFRVVAAPEATPHALARFVRLHRARALGTTEQVSRHIDRLSNPIHRVFVPEFAQRMAERGDLRVFELTVGNKVVASQIAYGLGDEIFMYYSGFDPAMARYNVMTTLSIEAIKWAIDHRLTRFNLAAGKDLSKLRWNPEQITYQSVTIDSPHSSSRLAGHVHTATILAHRLTYALRKASAVRLSAAISNVVRTRASDAPRELQSSPDRNANH